MSLPERLPNSQFPKYSDVGCYPLYYVTKRAQVLCACCASTNDEEHPEDPLAGYDANWEDAFLHCDECSERIESAYAEDEEEDEEPAPTSTC